MKDRIRQLMESQHMTQQTFANYIGMAPATLSSILNERTKPTLNTVEIIKNKFTNISIDWLMFGKGDMFIDDSSSESLSSTPQKSGEPGEQLLDFGETGDQVANAGGRTTPTVAPSAYHTAPRIQPAVRQDIVIKEREPRRITEIRVFFDDQTYESFVPKK